MNAVKKAEEDRATSSHEEKGEAAEAAMALLGGPVALKELSCQPRRNRFTTACRKS